MKFLITKMLLSDKNDSIAASLFINVFEIHIKNHCLRKISTKIDEQRLQNSKSRNEVKLKVQVKTQSILTVLEFSKF